MDTGISEIVGQAELTSGGSVQVYRALRSLVCATCGSAINEGTLFTRRRVKGIGVSIMPQCSKCAPFSLRANRKEKSALLRSLLAEQPANPSSRPDISADAGTEQEAKEKRIDEEVRRRLGPALNRGRSRNK
jgi:RNase P subunit RPR2